MFCLSRETELLLEDIERRIDPDNGIAPGTAWEDVPADFVCPVCGLDKDSFDKED